MMNGSILSLIYFFVVENMILNYGYYSISMEVEFYLHGISNHNLKSYSILIIIYKSFFQSYLTILTIALLFFDNFYFFRQSDIKFHNFYDYII